jgi:S-methylmethionine-dependent homocysteine/selenocysteine methylase
MKNKSTTIILDGGMGRELERIGAPFSQPFWSAQALMEAPEMVTRVHNSFILSGARVITTNSYAVVPPHIGEDLFYERGRELIALSAKLARRGADNAPRNVKVAACIPPVFGSYQPDLFDHTVAPTLITPFFEEQAPYADLFLGETISSIKEALAIQEVYKNFGSKKPLWLSFSLQEFFGEGPQPQLRSGDNIGDAIEEILQHNVADAILLNCCSVEDISAAFDICENIIKAQETVKFGAYANVFGQIRKQRKPTKDLSILRDDVSPEIYLEYAKEWKQKGASIIGGCCGIGPEYIALLSKKL